jgi:hypothetical protein
MIREEKLCTNCGTNMERLIDVIRPETICGRPGLAADGSSVTGSRVAQYSCPGCQHTQVHFLARGTWTIAKNVANA